MIDLSIIIVNYNSLDFLKACLDSIPACTRGLDTEVIVVDNASSDGSAAFLKDCMEMPGFQYTINESNNGFSRASNQGVGMATGLYLLFMNPDCRFAQGEMKEMLDFYKIQENTGAAGAKILNPNGKLQLSCRSFPTLARQFYESFFLHRMFKKSRIFGSYFMTWWDHRDIMEVDWLSGSFILMSKDAFLNAGKFSEEYFMYSEDSDLCLKLRRSGYRNFYWPLLTAVHEDGAIASRDRVTREVGIWKSRVTYFRKNYSLLHAKVASLLYFLGMVNRMVLFLILCLFRPSADKRDRTLMYALTLKRYMFPSKAGI